MNTEKFLDCLSSFAFVELAKKEAIEDWGVDVPQTVMFSSIGKKLADVFFDLNELEKSYISDVVEKCLESEDVALKNAVATGLLEAFHARTKLSAQGSEFETPYLGERATAYLAALVHWQNG